MTDVDDSGSIDLGVFIPINNNGWFVSTNAPQYRPSFDLNREVVQLAEHYDFNFALSMIKLRGWGGATEFWDYGLESFTLMAGLAAVTKKIKLYASTAVLTLHPALVARMAVTLDSIAPGRAGINIVTGWLRTEYAQLGLWPGDEHYVRRYDFAREYVSIIRELWETGQSDFKGDYFQLDDCRMKPMPENKIDIVCAGQSATGMEFCATYGDYNFVLGAGVNNPEAHADKTEAVRVAVERSGRDVGVFVLLTVVAAPTTEEAMARWNFYNEAIDVEALAWAGREATFDPRSAQPNAEDSTTNRAAATVAAPTASIGGGTLVGSYAEVAEMLDRAARVPGTKGIMLVFDDFVRGIDEFGKYVQPLMATRSKIKKADS